MLLCPLCDQEAVTMWAEEDGWHGKCLECGSEYAEAEYPREYESAYYTFDNSWYETQMEATYTPNAIQKTVYKIGNGLRARNLYLRAWRYQVRHWLRYGLKHRLKYRFDKAYRDHYDDIPF